MAAAEHPGSPRPTDDIVDVLIIGAGASGAAVAWSLAETRMSILCLEQGDWMKPTDFPEQRPRLGGAPLSATSTSARTVARGTPTIPINDDNSPIKVANFNGVGGSTILYTAHFPRMHPSDFRVQDARRRRRRLADRLLDARALLRRERPHDGRRRPGRRSGLSAASSPPLPPVPLGRSGDTLAQAFNRLGWHWWPSDSADRHARSTKAARRASTSATARRAARRARRRAPTSPTGRSRSGAGVELRTRCRVREITIDEHGMAAGVDLLRRRTAWSGSSRPRSSSSPATASARRACCSTRPRRAFPNGLANSTGLVGKNLMFHPWPQVSGYSTSRSTATAARRRCIWSQEFYETDRVARLRARLLVPDRPRHGPGQRGDHRAGDRPPAVGRGPPPRLSHAALRPHCGMAAICEDLPEEHNRVTLDPVLKDSHGIPAPKIDYRSARTRGACSSTAIARATEVLEAAGAQRTSASTRRC